MMRWHRETPAAKQKEGWLLGESNTPLDSEIASNEIAVYFGGVHSVDESSYSVLVLYTRSGDINIAKGGLCNHKPPAVQHWRSRPKETSEKTSLNDTSTTSHVQTQPHR